ISQLNIAICTIAASQAPWLWLYCIMQALAGHGDSGISACAMAYTVEFTDAKHRTVWGLNLNHGCTVGAVLVVLIAYLLRNYQDQLLCSGLCCLVLSLSLFLLSESPRWLVSVGRFAEADQVLRRIDRLNNGRNGRRLPTSFSTEALFSEQQSDARLKPRANFFNLLGEPSLRRRALVSWFLFFSVAIAYYGVTLGVGRLGGNVFVNQLASAAVEPPSRLFCAFVSLRLGRRPSVVGSFGLAGLCLLGPAEEGRLQEGGRLNWVVPKVTRAERRRIDRAVEKMDHRLGLQTAIRTDRGDAWFDSRLKILEKRAETGAELRQYAPHAAGEASFGAMDRWPLCLNNTVLWQAVQHGLYCLRMLGPPGAIPGSSVKDVRGRNRRPISIKVFSREDGGFHESARRRKARKVVTREFRASSAKLELERKKSVVLADGKQLDFTMKIRFRGKGSAAGDAANRCILDRLQPRPGRVGDDRAPDRSSIVEQASA
uniref:MFS domain-containing protein n=1 Tax=Macrostomum lignano TaxID=282301 RepID=A0A1I8HLU0_9PLAT